MKYLASIACAVSLMGAGAVLAQDDVGEPSAADTETEAVEAETPELDEDAEDPGKKMRCKQVRVVNTRIPTRVCLTVEEWEERNRETLEEKRRMRNRNSYCPASGPC